MIYNVQPFGKYQLFIEFIYPDGKSEYRLYKEDAIILAREQKKVAGELEHLVKLKRKGGEQ